MLGVDVTAVIRRFMGSKPSNGNKMTHYWTIDDLDAACREALKEQESIEIFIENLPDMSVRDKIKLMIYTGNISI